MDTLNICFKVFGSVEYLPWHSFLVRRFSKRNLMAPAFFGLDQFQRCKRQSRFFFTHPVSYFHS